MAYTASGRQRLSPEHPCRMRLFLSESDHGASHFEQGFATLWE